MGVLVPEEQVVLEARSADGTWVLGHSADGSPRGWLHTVRLAFDDGTSALSLSIRDEEIFQPTAQSLVAEYPGIRLGDFPVLPTALGPGRRDRGAGTCAGSRYARRVEVAMHDRERPFGPRSREEAVNLGDTRR